MKILITGAHFTPAVAVIEQLKKMSKAQIVYVGRNKTLEGDKTNSKESTILPSLGIKFIPIITGRLQRSFTVHTIPSLLKIPIGFIQAFIIILFERPDSILSFGGYVAVPIVIVGWLFSIPVIVHEQTLVTGLANKISFYFADKIAYSFLGNHKLSKRVCLTGNPLRHEILHPGKDLSHYRKLFDDAGKENLPVIMITGGNQGSHVLNTAIEEIISKLTKIAFIIHVTGESEFQDFERLEKRQNNHYVVKKWIGTQWGAILSRIDLVVSRAGINSLTELAYLGKPALVVPIPYLYHDEQNKNADFFEKLGLVQILPQSKLTGERLLENIKNILSKLDVLNKQAVKAKEVVITDAAKRLALETILLTTYEKNL